MITTSSRLGDIITKSQNALLDGWLSSLLSRLGRRNAGPLNELRRHAHRFLSLVGKILQITGPADTENVALKEASISSSPVRA